MLESVSSLRMLITKAFESVPCPPYRSTAFMTHEECLGDRGQLFRLSDDDFLWEFSRILLDLITTHTGDRYRTDDVESVIAHLNVTGGPSVLKLPKELSYARFDAGKASAVVAWLQVARNWTDLELYRAEVDSALNYWRDRAAGSGPSLADFEQHEVHGLQDLANNHKEIHAAVYRTDVGKVRDLIAQVGQANAIDLDGRTPLHVAGYTGDLEIIQLLVDAGADVNALSPGWTPLHDAAWRGKKEAYKLLVALGSDPNVMDTSGNSAKEIVEFANYLV